MRPVVFASLCAVSSIACGEQTHIEPLGASWMEWPAEVQVAKPVSVLIAGIMGCGSQFIRRYEVDEANSAIVFNPYQIVPDQPCVNIVPTMFVDRIDLVGLRPKTYELRSGDDVFGELVVTADPPSASPLMGAGRVSAVRDPDSCLRLRPVMGFAVRPMPLENPPDTTSGWMAFVTGTITEVAPPVCGDTRVFHLLTRN